MYTLSVRLLGDPGEAEDAVQEAFRKLLHALRRIEPRCLPRTYLMRVVYNVCVDYLRKKRPGLMPAVGGAPAEALPGRRAPEQPEAGAIRSEEDEMLNKAVTELGEVDRAAVTLRFMLGISNTEAAEILRMSRNTFDQRLHRALRSLRDKLDGRD